MSSVAWPQSRQFPFADSPELSQLGAAWDFSAKQFSHLRSAIDFPTETVACIAVSGSLNRMEGHAKSDLDILVVVDDRIKAVSQASRRQIYNTVWDNLRSVPELELLQPPKSGGVFSTCASWRAMTQATSRGVVDEDLTTFGQRMQLLLDAQPVADAPTFSELRIDLLQWYTESRVCEIFAESGPFHWLWQDVQRYWRSIRSRACWLHSDNPRKSLEVNLKLRSSRLVLIAGFLQAISLAEADSSAVIEHMEQELRLTPLERLAFALQDQADCDQLLTSYQSIWSHVAHLPNNACKVPSEILQSVRQLQDSVNRVPRSLNSWLF
jgi:hypothetical protein